MHDTGANVLLFLRRLLPTESDADLYEGFGMAVIQYRTRQRYWAGYFSIQRVTAAA